MLVCSVITLHNCPDLPFHRSRVPRSPCCTDTRPHSGQGMSILRPERSYRHVRHAPTLCRERRRSMYQATVAKPATDAMTAQMGAAQYGLSSSNGPTPISPARTPIHPTDVTLSDKPSVLLAIHRLPSAVNVIHIIITLITPTRSRRFALAAIREVQTHGGEGMWYEPTFAVPARGLWKAGIPAGPPPVYSKPLPPHHHPHRPRP